MATRNNPLIFIQRSFIQADHSYHKSEYRTFRKFEFDVGIAQFKCDKFQISDWRFGSNPNCARPKILIYLDQKSFNDGLLLHFELHWRQKFEPTRYLRTKNSSTQTWRRINTSPFCWPKILFNQKNIPVTHNNY